MKVLKIQLSVIAVAAKPCNKTTEIV